MLRNRKLVGLIAAFLFTSFSGIAFADNADTWGPAIGTDMPSNLMVTTANGETVNLHDLVGKKGMALAFVRSADWCPFCKRQLVDLNKRQAEFASRGINLVALSYDSVKVLSEFSNEFDFTYDLLSDPESEVINAFGIRNEDHEPGNMGYGIPHPGVMVFNRQCELVAKFAEEGYRKRPDIDLMLAAADKALAQ